MRIYHNKLHLVVEPSHKKINTLITQENAEATPDGKARRKIIDETVDIQMDDDAQAEHASEEAKLDNVIRNETICRQPAAGLKAMLQMQAEEKPTKNF